MKRYLAYTKAGEAPILLCDRFSFSAFLFGPLWLLRHRIFLPALIALGLYILVAVFIRGVPGFAAVFAIASLIGIEGQWWRGRGLVRRGWSLAHVVGSNEADSAYLRLLSESPDLQQVAA